MTDLITGSVVGGKTDSADDVEAKLDEADYAALDYARRISHDEVFSRLRERYAGKQPIGEIDCSIGNAFQSTAINYVVL